MKNASYSSTEKLLHWGMAIVMVGLFAFGLYMSDAAHQLFIARLIS